MLAVLENYPDAAKRLAGTLSQVTEIPARATRIILMSQLGDFSAWEVAATPAENPELGTEIIHRFSKWHANIPKLIDQLDDQRDRAWLWAPCQAISLIDKRSLNQSAVDEITKFLLDLHANSPHYTVRASAQAALRQWAIPYESISSETSTTWKSLSNGMRLVRIEPGTTRLGRLNPSSRFQGFPPHKVEISLSVLHC